MSWIVKRSCVSGGYRRLLTLLVAAVLLAGASACGSSGGPSRESGRSTGFEVKSPGVVYRLIFESIVV